MSYNKEEFDDFMDDVNDVYDQVKKITSKDFDITQITEEEKKLLEKQDKRKKIQEIKKEEEEDKLNKGNKGKGHLENYIDFCKKCFVEYTIKKELCYHCNSKTIPCKQRREELLEKAKLLKIRQNEKKEKQKKWELWQKTKKIFWKKNSINYEKWEYFTDSEEEDEKEKDPILPENDPSFKAMKKDLDDRALRVKKQKQKANQLKLKGNEYFKKRDYFQAIKIYSEALDESKQMKELYTNRALAYLKYEKFDKCIEDCDKILEFCEVLEDGFTKSKSICIKAFYRKIKAKVEGNLIDDKITEDFENLKSLVGEEDSEYIELMVTFKRKNKEKEIYDSLSNLNTEFTQVNDFLKEKGNNDSFFMKYDFFELSQILKNNDKQLIYFINKNGVYYLNKIFKKNIYGKDLSLIILLRDMSEKSETFIDDMMNYNLINNILKTINNLKDMDNEVYKKDNINFETIILIEELFEILVALTLNKKSRDYLNSKFIILNEIFSFMLNNLVESYKFYFPIYESCINFYSNLIINDKSNKEIKNYIIENFSNKIILVSTLIIKDKKFYNLKKMIYNLLCNLFSDQKFKENFYNSSNNIEFLKAYYMDLNWIINKILNRKNNKSQLKLYSGYLENSLSVYINSTLLVKDWSIHTNEINDIKLILNIVKFQSYIINNMKDFDSFNNLFYRILFFSNRNFNLSCVYKDCKKELDVIFNYIIKCVIDDNNSKDFSEACKFLAYIFNNNKDNLEIKKNLINKYFIEDNKKFFSLMENKFEKYSNDELIYCNLAKVLCNIIDIEVNTAGFLSNIIKFLINTVANKLGKFRINSAILLARLCKNENNLKITRELKGTEILINLKSYLI